TAAVCDKHINHYFQCFTETHLNNALMKLIVRRRRKYNT
ncbi:MAG: hypothetical protein ACJAT1_002110, partial [Marivirga sp.]